MSKMVRALFVPFVCFYFVASTNGQNYPALPKLSGDRNLTKDSLYELREFRGVLGTLVERFGRNPLKAINFKNDKQGRCADDTYGLVRGILRKDMDAIEFLDADFKPPSGILNGNILWGGDYSECISAAMEVPQTKTTIKGKYFSVLLGQKFVEIPTLNGLPVGVCLPDSCDESEVKDLMTIALHADSPSRLFSVLAVYDVTKPATFSSDAIAVIVIIILIVVIVAIGTIVDLYQYYTYSYYPNLNGNQVSAKTHNETLEVKEDDVEMADENTRLLNETDDSNVPYGKIISVLFRIAKAFSVFENTERLLKTSTAYSPLACLNGLRVISISWVILGHTYLSSRYLASNPIYAKSTLWRRFTFQPIVNGTFAVDTFLFISGLLVAFIAFNEIKSKGRLNWLYYFGHRFWRLTPMYAFVLAVFATLAPYMSYGPFRWIVADPQGGLYVDHHKCKAYWWTHLLYINNFYPNYGSFRGCMAWSWYLALDMQFYIFIAPVVIILITKVKVIGISFTSMLILVCGSLRGGLAAYFDMNQFAKPREHLDSPWVKFEVFYHFPFTRFSPYVVGLMIGYILHRTNFRIRMSNLLCAIGWTVATACALSVVYGLYYYHHNPGTNASEFISRLYVALSRTVWSFCLGWLVIACASGHGGWVNSILSWKLWAPLGRLTYAAYLVHPLILLLFFCNQRSTIMFSDSIVVYIFIANLIMTYGLAYVVSMLIEAPMMQLEKILLRR